MIPKIIHYCWFGGKSLPKSAIKCINSWKKFFPDYEIREWNESNFDVNMIPYTREAYAAKKYAFVSDFARFWVLHEYGGVYFDTDVEVIRAMDDIIETGPFMGAETPQNVAPGLGLATVAHHPFYKRYVEYYSDKHFTPAQPTMCRVVTDWWLEMGWKTDSSVQTIDGITIYPPDYFCPQAMMGAPINITENTRSIHHFDATWLPWYVRFRVKSKYFLFSIFNFKQ